MVRLSCITTRTGDAGETTLAGGTRVSKTCVRLDAMGDVDETNCHVGLLRVAAAATGDTLVAESDGTLARIQQHLFDLGALLAAEPGSAWSRTHALPPDAESLLESCMEGFLGELEPLDSFVLPGGGPIGASAHAARAVCRRAERSAWRLHAEAPLASEIPRYLNRLSDFLFVYARWASQKAGERECLWTPGLQAGTSADAGTQTAG